MSQKSTTVTFSFTSLEPRAWLVLAGNRQEPRVIEMQREPSSVWSASEDLIPDVYLCRYYSGDDLNVSYYGPAQINGGVDCGMDTRLSVSLKDESADLNFV